MTIGDRIKKRRIDLGMTLLELAEKIGVREATVQRYESGSIKNLKQETIGKLADALHTTPAYLMGWENTQTKKQNEKLDVSEIDHVYLSFAKDAQDNGIDPEDIKLVLDTIKKYNKKDNK